MNQSETPVALCRIGQCSLLSTLHYLGSREDGISNGIQYCTFNKLHCIWKGGRGAMLTAGEVRGRGRGGGEQNGARVMIHSHAEVRCEVIMSYVRDPIIWARVHYSLSVKYGRLYYQHRSPAPGHPCRSGATPSGGVCNTATVRH